MARRGRISTGKAPQGKGTKGKALTSGGPGFIGAKGSSRVTQAGSRKGGPKIKSRGSGSRASGRFE